MTPGAADPRSLPVRWAVSERARDEGEPSGDTYLVRDCGASILIAVVDGLGHGPEAAAAAHEAVAILEGVPAMPPQSLESLVARCHDGLRRTRGVVMTLASFDLDAWRLSWLAVGNVEAVLVRADPRANPAREWLVLRGGVVGYTLPPLRTSATPVAPRDTLVLATDGVRGGFAEHVAAEDPPHAVADRILTRGASDDDDSLVLVARFAGDPS